MASRERERKESGILHLWLCGCSSLWRRPRPGDYCKGRSELALKTAGAIREPVNCTIGRQVSWCASRVITNFASESIKRNRRIYIAIMSIKSLQSAKKVALNRRTQLGVYVFCLSHLSLHGRKASFCCVTSTTHTTQGTQRTHTTQGTHRTRRTHRTLRTLRKAATCMG